MLGTCYPEIEQLYEKFPKHEKIRIQQWVCITQSKKLCQVTTNLAWKRNRNTYAEILLEMIYNDNLEDPFHRIPPDGPLPVINRANVGDKQFAFVHKKKETMWNARRFSTPKRHSASFQDLQKTGNGEKTSGTPRGIPIPDQTDVLKPPRADVPKPQSHDSLTKSPMLKISQKTTGDFDEVAHLKAKLDIAQKNEQYLREELLVIPIQTRSRTISEQNKLIEELKTELRHVKRHEDAIRPSERPKQISSQRYVSYIDNFERETVTFTQAKIAEETLALKQGLKRHKEAKRIESVQTPQKPEPQNPAKYESLECGLNSEILGIEDPLKGWKELEKMQKQLKMEEDEYSREESLNYSNRSSEET